MIKVPFTLDELDVMADLYYADLKKHFNFQNLIAAETDILLTPLFNYLSKFIDQIIVGQPDLLHEHLLEISSLANPAKTFYEQQLIRRGDTQKEAARKAKKWFNEAVFKVFNYNGDKPLGFTKIRSGKLAYEHSDRFNLTGCPYCNSQYIFTIDKGYKTRPQFDHFLNKSEHPYYALSFYNLIPSCYVCNASVKGGKTFDFDLHHHPFLSGFEGLYRFQTGISAVDFLVDKKDFKIDLVQCKGADAKSLSKAERLINDLHLVDRYNSHRDYASEIITKSYMYNNTAIKNIFEDFQIKGGESIFKSEEEIKEMILGNFVNHQKLHKRILSKLTRDISKEFGLDL